MKISFCHKHASWGKWNNENTNWLLRQFISKKTLICTVTNEKLTKYVELINNRPKIRLWYNTPDKKFHNGCVLN
jgi:IS30 family transposase